MADDLTPPPHTHLPAQPLIAAMVAAGCYSSAEIAEAAGCAEEYVRTLQQSPLFLALVNSYREKFADKAIDRVLADILADTRTNFEWLKRLRDEGPTGDPKEARLQLRASEVLFDRQVPKRAERQDVRVGISLDARTVRRLEVAAADDDAIDVSIAPTKDG